MKMPKIRFKANDNTDYPDWNDNNLGELGSFYGGLSGKSKEDFVGGNCRYITYKNVYLNTFATPCSNDLVKIKPSEHQNKVKKFDVLFTQSSETFEEVGLSSIYLYDDEPYLNSFCKGFRFRNLDHICPEFIGYQLRSNKVRHAIMLMGQGISRINLRTEFLCKLTLSLPTLAEQHKIADLLLGVDAIIEKQQTEVATWEQYKKGLAQKLFDQEVRFKADDGSDFPAWKRVRIGDLGCFIGGLTFKKTDTIDSAGLAVLTATNIGSDGSLNYKSEVQFVDKVAKPHQYLMPNDIVICKSNGSQHLVGKAAKYDGGYSGPNGITVGAFCGIFRSSCPIIPFWFQSDDYKDLIKNSRQGEKGSLSNIKGSDIENHYATLPTSQEEQRKIAECLDAINDVIALAKDELEKWRELKKGLLQQLFV